VRKGGHVGFYSYRDPSPERTLGCFKKSPEFLRDFAKSGEDVTKFIIGAVGDASPLTTPKLKGTLGLMQYLRGESYEDRQKIREQMLNTSPDDLLKIAEVIDGVCKTNAICVVGGKDKLKACTELQTLIEI
jgi:Zn-dependent M16 (insulinase) family peptidase